MVSGSAISIYPLLVFHILQHLKINEEALDVYPKPQLNLFLNLNSAD